MKKTLLSLLAAALVILPSCGGDDDDVRNNLTITVDPSTVVSGFEELEGGELYELSSSSKLMIELFIYDSYGTLVKRETKKANGYMQKLTTEVSLPDKEQYTAVAITHVEMQSSSQGTIQFWDVKNENKLSTLTIADGGYIGNQDKILGFAAKKFNTAQQNLRIDVEPAGALLVVMYEGMNLLNMESYYLGANRSCDYATVSGLDLEYSNDSSNEIGWWINGLTAGSYNSGYLYSFVFPFGKTKFQFYGRDKKDDLYQLGDIFNVNIKEGKQYIFAMELKEGSDGITVSYGGQEWVSSGRSANPLAHQLTLLSRQSSGFSATPIYPNIKNR